MAATKNPPSITPQDDPYLEPESRAVHRAAYLDGLDVAGEAWVFGYGSLMWNPGFEYLESVPATLWGWHRSFCIYSHVYRGTPQEPGLVLGLDRGGSCHGMAYRIDAARVLDVLGYVWDREMVTGVYEPRTVKARVKGRTTTCHTYTVHRGHYQYAGRLELDACARLISDARGKGGSNRDYLANTVTHLDELGIDDGPLHVLLRLVEAKY